MDLNRILPQVIDIAEQASKAILKVYETDFGVEQKHDSTPLTQADLAAHQVIEAGLNQLDPLFPVLSEESAAIPFEERSSWETYWLVDPLDGTREFVKRNGEFTVNIALIHQGKTILGVVHVPVSGDCYYAARDCGAFVIESGSEPQAIRCRDLPSGTITVAGSRSHPGERLQSYLEKLGTHELVSMGSSLKFCLVAQGKADLYVRLGKTSEWDTAAAQCVVEEAGGQVTNTKMQPLDYNQKDCLLNPEFFVFGDKTHDWSTHLD